MLRRNLALAAVAAAAFAVPTMFTPGLAQAQIRIASAGPMTGQYASFGLQLRNGEVRPRSKDAGRQRDVPEAARLAAKEQKQ